MSDFFLSFHRISPICSANHLYACFLQQYIRRACKVSFFVVLTMCWEKRNFPLLFYYFLFFSFFHWSKIFCYYIDCLLYFYTVVFLLVDQSQRGSLFTLFLYNPLMGFLSVCGLSSMRYGLWEKAQELLRKFFHDIGQMITSSRVIGNVNMCRYPLFFCFVFYAFINFYTPVTGWTNGQILNIFHTFSVDCLPDQAYLQFYGDEFLRLLMIRFVFCCTTLRLHKLFRVRLNWIIIHVTVINTIWFIIISEKYLSHLSIFVIFVSWTWH